MWCKKRFTQAFLKIEQLRGTTPSAFSAWLFAIGDMTLIDLVRKETTQARGGRFCRQEVENDDLEGNFAELLQQLHAEVETGSRNLARKEAVGALQVAIAGLPGDQRRAVDLNLLQGMSIQETSDAMDRTTASVRSLIHRAKENLAEAMGRASQWLSQR